MTHDDLDMNKMAEAALAILYLTVHESYGGARVWKGLDWDLLDLLHKKGWIGDPKIKAKSVPLTAAGENAADIFLEKHFTKST